MGMITYVSDVLSTLFGSFDRNMLLVMLNNWLNIEKCGMDSVFRRVLAFKWSINC